MSLGTIGSFEIIASLGSGARGSVYRAQHLTLGRIVAIKQLAASVAPDSDDYLRLQAEIDRLSAVTGGPVVTTFSVELADGRPVIEMESLGESLEKTLRHRSFDLGEALRVVHDILAGLRALHAVGIAHANLKPSNVLQDTTTGSWKISDGGITGIEPETMPTLLAASVLYVAPETVWKTPRADERSDLLSVGMIGLEAILGPALLDAFPSPARSATPSRWLSWLERADEDAAPLSVLRPEMPLPVTHLFTKLLAKNPDLRPASASAALEELEAALSLLTATPREPRPTPTSTPTPRPTPTPTPHPAASWMPTPVPTVIVNAGQRASRATTRLLVTGPGGFDARFELTDRTYRIGRDSKNDIVLPDDTKGVSRMHAELRREQGRYVMVDLDSQNGLWVRGRRKHEVPLEPGVPIQIGSYSLTLQADASVPAAGARPASAAVPSAKRIDAGKVVARIGTTVQSLRLLWPPKTTRDWTIAGVAAAVLVVGLTWALWPSSSPPPELTNNAPVADPPPPPPPPPDEKAIARENALTAASEFIARREYTSALALLDPLLLTNSADARAQELKQQALTGIAEQQRATAKNASPATGQNATGRRSGGQSGRGGQQGVVTPDLAASRESRLAQLYEQAKATQDTAEALAAWQALHNEAPNYRDVDSQLNEARLRAVQEALAEGRKLEGKDLLAAQAAYSRALKLDPNSSEAQQAAKAGLAKLRAEGVKAFQKAEQLFFGELFQDAAEEYRKVLLYLPAGDEMRTRAEDKLKRIKGGGNRIS